MILSGIRSSISRPLSFCSYAFEFESQGIVVKGKESFSMLYIVLDAKSAA